MANSNWKSGQNISGWILVKELGKGGNGQVWQATKQNQTVALKILMAFNDSYRYERFKNEVKAYDRFKQEKGTLPILRPSLPAKPTPSNPPWIAMPVATPLVNALPDNRDITVIVQIIHDIALTLTNLADKYNVSHRDIKPDNLFQYNSEWVIGDFGLVSLPDADTLTEEGKKLGPANFIAPEMIEHADEADGKLADVYSLAKTLWVLGVNRDKFPPPGELRQDREAERLSTYSNHEKAYILDRLIERATRHNPKERPTMREFCDELAAWLKPSEISGANGSLKQVFSEFRDNKIHQSKQQAIEKTSEKEKRSLFTQEGDKCYSILVSALERIRDEAGLPPEFVNFKIGGGNDVPIRRGEVISDNLVKTIGMDVIRIPYFQGEKFYSKFGYLILKDKGVQWTNVILVAGIVDNKLGLHTSHQLCYRGENRLLWYGYKIVPIASSQQEKAVSELTSAFLSEAANAGQEFIRLAKL